MTSRLTGRSKLLVLLALSLGPVAFGCTCGDGTNPGDGDSGGRGDAYRERPDAYADDANEVVMDDAGRTAQNPDRCRVESSDVYLLGTDNDLAASSRVIDVASGAAEFVAAWREAIEGFPQIRVARIPSTTGAPAGMTVTEGLFIHDEPAIAAVEDGYVVGWIDNSADDLELFVRTVASSSLGPVQRLTTRPGRDDSPSLVGIGENVLASYVESRDTVRVPMTQLLTATGTLSGASHEINTPPDVGRPSLAPREGGAVMMYAAGGPDFPDVSLQRLDTGGVPVGAAEIMTSEHNAGGDVDVGLTPADGAAVFTALVAGSRRDVRVRLLDGTGEPSISEFALNEGAEQGDSASVARLRQAVGWSEGCRDGYAVVYRSYPDGGTTALLRLVLLDAGADVVRAVDLNIPDISDRGGRTTLRISGDGQLLVAWTDARADRIDMRAARIRCD